MAYATITDSTPTAGVVLQGDFRISLIDIHIHDVVHVECSENDFTTVETVEIISEQSSFSKLGNEPRSGVKYRLRSESNPVNDTITYVLGQ
jgi:hypothetical protein